MNSLSLILLVLSLCCISGGAAKHTARQHTSLNTNKVYCERSFTNFAWGYQHHGIYVMSKDKV